jgi:hypothetical protein
VDVADPSPLADERCAELQSPQEDRAAPQAFEKNWGCSQSCLSPVAKIDGIIKKAQFSHANAGVVLHLV